MDRHNARFADWSLPTLDHRINVSIFLGRRASDRL